MADEQSKPPLSRPSAMPAGFDWPSLISKDGDALEIQYRHVLDTLGKETGTLGVIFRKAQNKIQDPAKLKRLLDLINAETWIGLDIDIKGEIYEGLLQKNAEDIKTGAGQYFTPRPLIKAIVQVMQPQPDTAIYDPACGTGGFLLAAHDYISGNFLLDPDQKRFLKFSALRGKDIVDAVGRLCLMNLYLHGIGGDQSPVEVGDSLIADPGDRFDIVLSNPPFGKKSSITIANNEGEGQRESLTYERPDFWATTSNKQLNFVQHIKTILKINGRAASVVPDNVLFEGGAGEAIRRKLLHECEVHTLLRLPTGVFYAQGVKANVLFFDRKPAREKPWTETLWIYDLRTNMHFTLKTNPLTCKDLIDFVDCYHAGNIHERKETDRFHSFSFEELMKGDRVNLDIFWLKDESLGETENLPEPDVIADDIVTNLESALVQFKAISEDVGKRETQQ